MFENTLQKTGHMLQITFRHIAAYAKSDPVLSVSFVLALFSCLWTSPSIKYIEYIDIHTLIMLFCLMIVVEGLKEFNFFSYLGEKIISKVKTQRGIIFALVSMCFISSMLITNDVALITFVPLGILIMEMTEMVSPATVCICITLMTLAGNLGSMLTPMGNPQNLYLFSVSSFSIIEFIKIMLPYTVLSFIMLSAIITLRYKSEKIMSDTAKSVPCTYAKLNRGIFIYISLFILCIVSLAGLINIGLLFLIVVFTVALENRKLFTNIDYSLLLTFIFFFIFTGNLSNLGNFQHILTDLLSINEKAVSIGASQLISNVPAALLLSGYTYNIQEIIIGTNLGGLGTLIASMASLISYKQLSSKYPQFRTRYLITFTVMNIVFLAILYLISI